MTRFTRFGTNAASLNKSASGRVNHLLENGYDTGPSWDTGYFVFRILPGLSPESGYKEFDTFRYQEDWGTWLQVLSTVPRAFKEGVSFVLSADLTDDRYSESPYATLYRNLRKYSEGGGMVNNDWIQMIQSQGAKAPVIPAPVNMAYLYGLIYHRGDKDTDTVLGDVPRVVLLKPNVASRLLSILQEYPEFDAVAPDKGVFVIIWSKSLPAPFDVGNTPGCVVSWMEGAFGYNIAVCSTYPHIPGSPFAGMSAALSPDAVAWAKVKVIPWENTFVFRTYRQQAELISRHLPHALLRHMWDGYPEYLDVLTFGAPRRSTPSPYSPAYAAPGIPARPSVAYESESEEPLYTAGFPASVPGVPAETSPGPVATRSAVTRSAATPPAPARSEASRVPRVPVYKVSQVAGGVLSEPVESLPDVTPWSQADDTYRM